MARFTIEDAARLVSKMRVNYGKKFADQWAGVEPDELEQEMVDQYQGLTSADFLRGIERMKKEKWPPTVPEFRQWCEPESTGWLGANEAWAIARNSIDFNGNELTVVWTNECAVAFDAVSDMIRLGDKYQIAEAKKIFIDRYERLVTESRDKSQKPVYQVSYGNDKEQRKRAITEAQIAGLLPESETALLLETIQSPEDAKREAAVFDSVAKEHLENIRKLIKRPEVQAVQDVDEAPLFDVSGNLPEWADPFDERGKYMDGLKADGKPVPMALRSDFYNRD